MQTQNDKDEPNDMYGVVIDAGSSGSRIQIYKWPDPQALSTSDAEDGEESLHSVPQIYQHKNWTYRITPGLSSFENKPEKAFKRHIKPLLDFAETIIPKNKIEDVPVFIQATAGMRLLPEKKKDKILDKLCHDIAHSTNFYLPDCNSQIQVIDGETEGIYGWLGLNYLLGNFNKYDATESSHLSYGFMDMGGASTQIAFAPSNPKEIEKHRDDISTVYLKSTNGDIQEWDVFVSTWLGFGANQARNRYLAQLVNALPENTNKYDDDDFKTKILTDPCLPKGCKTEFEFKDKDFSVIGSGNYEQCTKSIYPLLLKNLPCTEEPCLFNGVHAPQIDFYKDTFVGISEYWYTANDVFKTGGEYNFHAFSQSVKEFCESDWDTIKANGEKGMYNGIPTKFLADSCFKANWVLNVLHEGFNLPRIGIEDTTATGSDEADEEHRHIPFQSTDSINGHELSWTLGRILLYASGLINIGSDDITVGVQPSSTNVEKLGKKFIPGALSRTAFKQYSKDSGWLHIFVIFVFMLVIAFLGLRKLHLLKYFSVGSLQTATNQIRARISKFRYTKVSSDPLADLEEGVMERGRFSSSDREGFQFRSRSMMNLRDPPLTGEEYPMDERNMSCAISPSIGRPKKLRTAFSMADFTKFAPKRHEKKGKSSFQ